MKIKYAYFLFTIFMLIALSNITVGQDLNLKEMIEPPQDKYTRENTIANLDEAIEPLLDFFGFYTGGGLYHSANTHGLGGFDVGVRVIAMMISEDQKPDLPFPSNDAAYGGIFKDMELMPLPLLQVSVGLPGSLEAMGRFFTYPIGEGEDKGNITLIGLGVKYGLIQNMLLPRVAIVAGYHYLNVPEKFDFGSANNISAALVVSKGFAIIDLYGGVGYDYTTLAIDLDFPPPIGPVKKEFNKGNIRGNLGLKIKPFPLLFVHADYNFGGVQGFNVGLGLNFR